MAIRALAVSRRRFLAHVEGFALSFEARNYLSKFKAFGIEDPESWEPGFYGGNIDGVSNHDLLFTTALAWVF